MAAALKKHLDSLKLGPDDLVLFHVPLGAPPEDWYRFVKQVTQETGKTVICVQPGFSFGAFTPAQLAEHGLMRFLPAEATGSLESLEEEAHQAIRIAFAAAREHLTEPGENASTFDTPPAPVQLVTPDYTGAR